MNKLLLFISYFLITNTCFFSQNLERFNYLEKDNAKVTIDLSSKEFKNLLSIKKAILYCGIYDSSLNPPDGHKKEIEGWLNPYNSSKFYTHFSVFNIESNEGYTFNFTLADTSESFTNYTKSMAFVLTKDSLLISELLKNRKDFDLYGDYSLKNKNNEVIRIFTFINIDNFSEFQWKTNQLLFNLDHVPLPEKKEKLPAPKKVFFQLGFSSGGAINKKNTNFDGFSSNQIDLLIKGAVGKNNLGMVGGGISMAQNTFSTTSNLLYGEAGSLPLDSIYASLSGVSEKYTHQTINIAFLIAIKTEINKKNGFFEFSLSPFYALQSKLSSTVTGGSITTYGFKNQITDYLYDIPELGLKTQTEEILNVQNYFKTSSYGFNAGVSYNINLGTLIVAPNINFKLISIKNKNSISKAYSIPEDKYNGLFATFEKTTPLLLTVGLSISF